MFELVDLFIVVLFGVIALALSFWFPFAFVTLIIFLNERFFGIFPYQFGDYDLIRGLCGPVLLFIAIIIQFVFRWRYFRSGVKNTEASYLSVVFAIVGVVVFSTIWGGLYVFNQSLRTLIFQPAVFFYYSIYLYLCFFCPSKKQILRFLKFIVIISLILVVLMCLDALIFQHPHLLKYANVSERVGLVRIVVFVTGFIWAYYYCLASVFEEKYPTRLKIMFGFAALSLLVAINFILIDRQVMLSCFVTTVIVAWSMSFIKKSVIICVSSAIILFIIANSGSLYQNSFLENMQKLTVAEITTKNSSVGIRLKAIEFYYSHYKSTYGIGFGVLGSRHEYHNPVSMGLEKGYNLNDISLAGIIFRFGIPGLIVIIFTIRKMFRDTKIILQTKDPNIRSMIRGIRYTTTHMVIIFPLTTFLFYSEKAVYFATMFFIIERLRNIVSEEIVALEA